MSEVKNQERVDIKVADVYYNDDDGYDMHVAIRVGICETEDDVEDELYARGLCNVEVEDIYFMSVKSPCHYDLYDVIEVFDED